MTRTTDDAILERLGVTEYERGEPVDNDTDLHDRIRVLTGERDRLDNSLQETRSRLARQKDTHIRQSNAYRNDIRRLKDKLEERPPAHTPTCSPAERQMLTYLREKCWDVKDKAIDPEEFQEVVHEKLSDFFGERVMITPPKVDDEMVMRVLKDRNRMGNGGWTTSGSKKWYVNRESKYNRGYTKVVRGDDDEALLEELADF